MKTHISPNLGDPSFPYLTMVVFPRHLGPQLLTFTHHPPRGLRRFCPPYIPNIGSFLILPNLVYSELIYPHLFKTVIQLTLHDKDSLG